MNELDKKIAEELGQLDNIAGANSVSHPSEIDMTQIVIQQNRHVMRKLHWWTWGWHLFFLIALLIGAWFFLDHSDPTDIALGLFVSMGAFVGFSVSKAFFVVVSTRLRLETKLKELEVGIAELKDLVQQIKR